MDFLDKPREACGIFGMHDYPEAAKLCYFGLYALQHRGQESASIISFFSSSVRSVLTMKYSWILSDHRLSSNEEVCCKPEGQRLNSSTGKIMMKLLTTIFYTKLQK
jgi:hypothetical protein